MHKHLIHCTAAAGRRAHSHIRVCCMASSFLLCIYAPASIALHSNHIILLLSLFFWVRCCVARTRDTTSIHFNLLVPCDATYSVSVPSQRVILLMTMIFDWKMEQSGPGPARPGPAQCEVNKWIKGLIEYNHNRRCCFAARWAAVVCSK